MLDGVANHIVAQLWESRPQHSERPGVIAQELRDVTLYAQGYNGTHPMIKWLWEIVLEEWSDDNRRKLLTFSTGSDRAPVNGLKSLKFYIIKDGQDDKRLPSSHTCFNQLLLPHYSRKEILRERLQVAVENSTGFGMV